MSSYIYTYPAHTCYPAVIIPRDEVTGRKKVRSLDAAAELPAYTRETYKIFHNTLKQEGGNSFLKTPAAKDISKEPMKS